MSLSKVLGVDPFFTLNRFNVSSAIAGDNSTLGFSIGNGTIGGTITATKLREYSEIQTDDSFPTMET
jgi:hypothetical protein